MKNVKWVFVLYSLGAIASMCAIGVAVGMRSLPIAILAIVALILIMGNGFKTKKKMREQGLF
ncbi:YlaF family protein [Sporosarcina limicola]|uniref:Membrane protein YhfC n=1 Tax=Sporosarcina limicola TaxID=34101 RepID=A0A927MGS7_9BACL|nr:YlaF family protein [Sporosarcina limicola]MBE1553603.1 putative membrane protein YhfC [Sporosarcina limicola]